MRLLGTRWWVSPPLKRPLGFFTSSAMGPPSSLKQLQSHFPPTWLHPLCPPIGVLNVFLPPFSRRLCFRPEFDRLRSPPLPTLSPQRAPPTKNFHLSSAVPIFTGPFFPLPFPSSNMRIIVPPFNPDAFPLSLLSVPANLAV